MSPRRVRRELEKALPDGWQITGVNGSGHYKLMKPGCQPVIASSTPSCPFWLKHVLGDIRRAEKQAAASKVA